MCPNVSAVPTLIVLLLIVVEPEPKVAIPVTLRFCMVEKPVCIAPDACACIFTLPALSLIAVASIPVNAAPLPIKLVAVMTPALPILILLPTSICPIPPNEFAVTIPDTMIPVSV